MQRIPRPSAVAPSAPPAPLPPPPPTGIPVQAAPAAPPPGAAHPVAPDAAPPPPSQPPPQAELDALARRLVAPLSRLLRAELRGDRERLGRLRDR
ncbi:hypothetical protein [Streptomyces sp. NPDC058621]|uniref:hypothetical protein n=1 Tax=Streptomyces sp. NPDC058621 TaxID=3346561 RepID=UPI0036497503